MLQGFVPCLVPCIRICPRVLAVRVLGGRNVAGGETEAEIKISILLLKLLMQLLLG